MQTNDTRIVEGAMAEQVKHKPVVVTSIDEKITGVSAKCSCGWEVNFAPYSQRSWDMAERAMEDHGNANPESAVQGGEELPILITTDEERSRAAKLWPDPIDVAATQRMFACLLGRERQLRNALDNIATLTSCHDAFREESMRCRDAIAKELKQLRSDSPVPQGANDGAALIQAERMRQINVEGWTPKHDDEHDAGQLVCAAVTYALEATYGGPAAKGTWFKKFWCWEDAWFKPKNMISDLVKAGALIAAEIDRLQRLSRLRGEG